jgi:hypothetical protein
MSLCRIEGNSYPVRRELYALGARWNGADKHWWIDEDKLEEAKALVAAIPPAKPKKPFICRCPVCGTEFDVNNRPKPTNQPTNE